MVLGGEVRIRGMRQRIRGMFLEDCQVCVCVFGWVGGRSGKGTVLAKGSLFFQERAEGIIGKEGGWCRWSRGVGCRAGLFTKVDLKGRSCLQKMFLAILGRNCVELYCIIINEAGKRVSTIQSVLPVDRAIGRGDGDSSGTSI